MASSSSFVGAAHQGRQYGSWKEASSASEPSVVYMGDAKILIVCNAAQWELARTELLEAMGHLFVMGLDVEYIGQEAHPLENRFDPSVEVGENRCRNINKGRDPLLQLGAPGLAVLVRLCFFEFDSLPSSLHQLLFHKDILFVGVEVIEDAQRLNHHWRLRVRNSLDLRHVCVSSERFNRSYHYHKFSLKSIGAFLKQDIQCRRPNVSLVCSNWAAPALSLQQIHYAAKDALAAVGSFVELVKKFLGIQNHWNSSEVGGAEYWRFYREKYRCLVNKPFAESALDKLSKEKRKGIKLAKGHSSFGDVDKMKPRQFRKLADSKNCSDSDLDFDFEAAVEKKVLSMHRHEQLNLVEFYEDGDANDCNGNGVECGSSGSNSDQTKRPVALIEKELLDWCIRAKVPTLNLTMTDKVNGVKRRYGVTIEIEEAR